MNKMYNLNIIQKQLKAFNKALSRADKAGILSDEIYEAISDLIDPERMTKGGAAKAGKKYLESLESVEVLAYSSDIRAARQLLEIEKMSSVFDVAGNSDTKGFLWKLHQELVDAGMPFDSDQVKAVEDGEKDVSVKDMALHMARYKSDPNYGLFEFNEWFSELPDLRND